ncbi:hypothetical protein ACUOFU_13795 [Microbacterium arabinogalactanolyticum]|uniref:hypothetical protein n=1 Tax=Microbacterium arabinogalactanolyticum TaxID=69365 RepID=UPI004043DAFA
MTAAARMLLRGFSELGATDTMCHLGQWPYRLSAFADAGTLREYGRRHGLHAIWVSHLAALFGFDTRTGNEAVLSACACEPLLRPFAVIDPSETGWREELEWAADAGAQGVRVAPGMHHYDVALAAEVIDAAARRDLLVQVIVRLDDARVRHPSSPARDLAVRDLAELVRSRPSSPLHLSGLNLAEATEFSRHLGDDVPPGVRLDMWHLNGPTGVVSDPGAPLGDRRVFGSGFPVQTPEATMLQIASAGLPADRLRAIVTP